MTNGDYLQLCEEEKELLSHLQEYKQNGTFKKIVVILNSANALQLDFLDDYDIDAVLWAGDMGMTGMNAVAKILAGEIVPSGRLVDTFLKDNHAAPAMVNVGATPYTNWQEYELDEAQNNSDQGIAKCNKNYVVYQEGIYVGYRYFETRYEDYVLGRGNAGDYKYDEEVAFPFGYGLSYTDYDVKNGVEKAAVEICGYDKQMVKSGETVTYTITVSKEDLTSYDSNQAKTYILEDGDYYFTAAQNAHEAVNNILMAKAAAGVSVDQSRMSGTGEAALASCWTNTEFDDTTYAKSSVTGNEITNRFDHADLNKYEGTSGQKITYLTRNDWTGTFPKQTVSLSVTEQMWNDGLTHEESGRAAIVESMKEKYYSDVTELPETGQSNGLTLYDLIDTDAEDEQWTQLVEQMSFNEMKELIYNGFHQTIAVESIAMPATLNENGPSGFTANLIGGASAMCYTGEDVMAATFNDELINRVGQMMAEDFIHASSGNDGKVYAAMYGPGANIHRTAYSGRNCEYFSEDGWLSGKIAASEIQGIQQKGVFVYVKHFALNDQEEGRYGLGTWANEQAIREIYLEGFEGAVTEGNATGVMSAFNRLGVVWSGADYGLMTGVLRDEWGAKGAAVTDCSVTAPFMDYRMGLLAGQDIWDGYSTGMATLDGLDKDAAIVTAMQNASKHIAYSISRSHAMNIGNAEIVPVIPWWKLVLIVCIVISAALTAFHVVMLVKTKNK